MICLVGKTSSGKTTIAHELVNLGMESVVTTTTRPMRDGEKDGVTYNYISEKEFLKKKDNNEFAEFTYYITVHGRWYYGTQHKDLENHKNKVIILNPNGIKELEKKIDITDWFVVYLYCSDEITKQRLIERGDDEEEAKRRIKADDKDFVNIERFVDIKMPNDGHNTPEMVAKTIKRMYEAAKENI